MKSKKDSGFTLVELIVVIVVLAILIGVTIGGIYMYVGKARHNTDINNAKAIEDSTYAMMGNYVANAPSASLNMYAVWKDEVSIEDLESVYNTSSNIRKEQVMSKILMKTFPNGLPKCNEGYFVLGIGVSQNGYNDYFNVKCKVFDGTEDFYMLDNKGQKIGGIALSKSDLSYHSDKLKTYKISIDGGSYLSNAVDYF